MLVSDQQSRGGLVTGSATVKRDGDVLGTPWIDFCSKGPGTEG